MCTHSHTLTGLDQNLNVDLHEAHLFKLLRKLLVTFALLVDGTGGKRDKDEEGL